MGSTPGHPECPRRAGSGRGDDAEREDSLRTFPAPTSANHFPAPTMFYEFDYTTNAFTAINAPAGGTSANISAYITNMLVLPDGTVLQLRRLMRNCFC